MTHAQKMPVLIPKSGVDPCFSPHSLLCSPYSDAITGALQGEGLCLRLGWKTFWAANISCHSQPHTQLLAQGLAHDYHSTKKLLNE